MEYSYVSGVEKNMAIKICQICSVEFTLKHFLKNLILEAGKSGWEVHAISNFDNFVKDNKYNKYYKCIVHDVKFKRNLNFINHIINFFKILKIFKKENFDIIHVHTPLISIIARIAAKLSGCKVIVYTVHGFYFHDQMTVYKQFFHQLIEKFLSLFTDVYFFQSNEDCKNAINLKISNRKNSFWISNGVMSKNFEKRTVFLKNKNRNSMNIRKDTFVVGTISRLVEEKGIKELIFAFEKFQARVPNSLLIIVGERLVSDHNKDINLFLKEKKNSLSHNLLLLGYRSNVSKILSMLDVFCLLSWREGMPRSIIEAMMTGLPLIGTNIRGTRELIQHNKNGFLVPVKDTLKTFECLDYIHKNQNIISLFGNLNAQIARKKHEEKNIVMYQINLLKKILSEKLIIK